MEKNSYPIEIIKKEMQRTKDKWSKTSTQQDKPETTDKFIVLPYVSNKCEQFALKLRKLVKDNIDNVDLNIAWKAPKTIGNFFPYKDKVTNNLDKSYLIYKLTCKTCGEIYIGKTYQLLSCRMNQHKKSGSPAKHEKDLHHVIDYDNVEVIDGAQTDRKLRIKELLHILKSNPSINKQLNSQSSYEIKSLLLNAHKQE